MLIRSTPCFSADITSHKSPVVIIAIVTLVTSVHTKIVFIDHFICPYNSGYIYLNCLTFILVMRYSLTDYNTGNNRLKLIWCVVRKGQYRIHMVPHLSYTALSFSHFTTYKTFLYYFFQCDVSISLEITTVFNVDGISFSRFVKTTLYDLNYADYSEYYRTFWIYLLTEK